MSFKQVICLNKIITRLNDLLCRLNKIITRLNKIITRLNDLLCRSNKLFILFKQDDNSFKRLIIGHNLPKRAGTYRNRPELTETDIQKYRNRLHWVPKWTLQCTETEQNVVSAPEKVGQVMVENKCMCVVQVGR